MVSRAKSAMKLASEGGKPVRTAPWSVGPFHFQAELKALARTLSGPALPLALGPQVMAYRELLKKTYRSKYVVTTSSGTTAVHVALAGAGVGAGDEVITTPVTDYGTVIGVLQLNAVAVFCDVAPDTLVMSPESLEKHITRRTKAIIPIHIAGYPADMRAIMRVARKHGLKVIEDCAQCHLAKIGPTYLGCFGDFGAFSTNESKAMKCGEGGFVLCKKPSDAKHMDLFADKSYRRFPGAPATPAFPAVNVRMSDIAATIAREQLKQLPAWIKSRRAAGEAAEKIVSRYPCKVHARPPGARCAYWFLIFRLDERRTSLQRAEFAKLLQAEGIPCWQRGNEIVPEWEVFRRLNRNPKAFASYQPGALRKGQYRRGQWPEAKRSLARFLTLPINQYTGTSELRDLDRALEKIFSARR